MRGASTRRALSPVLGTILVVAIVVLLASVAAYVTFGLTEEREPAPNVVLDLAETAGPAAHDFELENGDPLRGEKVTIRGIVNEDGFQDRLAAGETVTVYPIEDTVTVVWFGEHGTSYVLATFEPETDLPEPDEDCNWVESQTGGHTSSVTVDVVVDCNVMTQGDVDVVDPGIVIGDVESDANTVDVDHGEVYGSVTADSALDLDGSRVVGDVVAGDDVTITDETTVGGDIETGSAGSIDIDSDSTVDGSLSAGDDIALASMTVGGDVEAPDVDIANTEIDGSVVGTSIVSLDGVTVSGDVYAPAGSFSCTDSTINGQDCAAYTPEDPANYEG